MCLLLLLLLHLIEEAVGWYLQFEYDDWLAAECGCPPIEEWRKQMYFITSKRRMNQPETYRDQWEDEHLILQAQEEFSRHFSKVHQ